MTPKFRIDKATQAAALFLKYGGNEMKHLKLMKLLYLAERESLIRWGHPLTYDLCVSMPHGTALSQTLDYIHGNYEDLGVWGETISPIPGYMVKLNKNPGTESLSEAEEKLIKELFDRYGGMSEWDIAKFTKKLPEWKNPGSSSIPIEYGVILRGENITETEITAILDELDGLAELEKYMKQ